MQKRIFLSYRWISTVFIILVLVFGMFTGASAKPYYEGKVISVVIPTESGGGDIMGRLIAEYLTKYIPGNPNTLVRNMPAADGLAAGNFVYKSKPDGKTLLKISGKVLMHNLLRPKGTDFRLGKMIPLYASPFGSTYYCKPELVPQPKDIIKAKGLIHGHSAVTAGPSAVWVFSKAILGFESKDVFAYGGTGPGILALLAGEITCSGGGTDNYAPRFLPIIKKGVVIPVFESGLLGPNGDVVKDPAAPPLFNSKEMVPTVKELYMEIYGKEPSGPMWEAYKAIISTRSFDNAFLLPPGTPTEYVKILEKAFENIVKDKDFLESADRVGKGARHIVGKDLTRAYERGMNMSEETIKFIKDHLTENYNVKF